MFTNFSEILNAEMMAAALSTGRLLVSQTRFVVRTFGPLTQSGYVMAANGTLSSPKTVRRMADSLIIVETQGNDVTEAELIY
jgi:hypothetical protein